MILLDLFGGPSHIDTFDMKPDAPDGIRGEFGTIATALPGVRVCEHLPQLARRLDKLAVVRSVTHKYNSHNPYGVMTGYDGGHDQTDYFARPTNHPSVPSVCQFFGVGRGAELPGYVMLPAAPGYTQGLRRAGPYGGYLGPKFDPVFSTADAHAGTEIGSVGTDFYNPNITPRGEPQAAEDRRRDDARRARTRGARWSSSSTRRRRSTTCGTTPPGATRRSTCCCRRRRRPRSTCRASRTSSATATATTCSGKACCSRGGWSKRA